MTRGAFALLLLVGCYTQKKPMPYEPPDLGSEQLVYNGFATQMPLRGPSAQILTLPTTGALKQITWAPTDRRAADVEIRVRIQSAKAAAVAVGLQSDPQVLYRLEYGHGMSVLNDPSRSPPSTHPDGTVLPGRGVLRRLTAREIKLTLYYAGNFGTGSQPTDVVCSVSFMPVLGMALPPPPESDALIQGLTAKQMIFPPSATEWRLYDQFGAAYTAAFAVDILIATSTGIFLPAPGALTPLDRHRFADWTPIPVRAAAWTNLIAASPDTTPINVSYR